MKFINTKIKGCYIIEPNLLEDSRGYFSRIYCDNIFQKETNIKFNLKQINQNFNKKAFTLRGLHMQKDPYSETKIVRCVNGSIQDVVVDIRKNSKTYLEHVTVNLSETNLKSIIVPKGCLHGYLTLEDNSCATYLVDQFYMPKSEIGYRYDEKKFNIYWQRKPLHISEKDLAWDIL